MKHFLTIALCLLCLNIHAQQDSTKINPPTRYNYYYYGWGWHKGLNMNLDLSAFAQFGSHARHGAGFTERLSATYVSTFSDKLWAAVGTSFSNTNWGGDNLRSGEVYALLGYRLNEHWEFYAWAQKNLTNNYGYYYPYMSYMYGGPYGSMMGPGDRIGGAVKYNVNPNVSFQVSVEGVNLPKAKNYYFDDHQYPTPQP